MEYIKILKRYNDNLKQLSQLIDKYLIPQELEKKTNAEVSTPFKLRQEMLDKMPCEFWSKPQLVFEPCSGKGGFIIDIVDRFMEGLKDYEKDDKKRYKLIVEKCLYFSDINPTNIFICKLLLDPFDEYKLNYNEGDTLELDIKKQWDLDGFDAVIGNPPYNKGKNSNFYIYFIDKARNLLLNNGYMLYVIPNRFLIKEHVANRYILNLNPLYIKHTCSDFKNISTDIGYILCENCKFINNAVCEFDEKTIKIDLLYSTPTTTNKYKMKEISDKILNFSSNKIIFTTSNNYKKAIFIKRQWVRYHPLKKSGGYHIFQLLDEINTDDKLDGRYTEHFKNIEWYLTRSNLIRFITKLYASNMNVPPFLWISLPCVNIETCDNIILYNIFNITHDEINIIEHFLA
jgi:hypothetical protein